MNLLSSNSLLSVGDVMPDWALIGPDGKPFSFYKDSVAGNILVVLFNPAPDTEATSQLSCFQLRLAAFKEAGARVYFVAGGAEQAHAHARESIPCLLDHQRQISLCLRPLGGPVAVVFRQNNHVAGVFCGDSDAQATSALETVRAIHAETATLLMDLHHPPVLLVPEVFSADECRELINIFHTKGQVYLEKEAALNLSLIHI